MCFFVKTLFFRRGKNMLAKGLFIIYNKPPSYIFSIENLGLHFKKPRCIT